MDLSFLTVAANVPYESKKFSTPGSWHRSHAYERLSFIRSVNSIADSRLSAATWYLQTDHPAEEEESGGA